MKFWMVISSPSVHLKICQEPNVLSCMLIVKQIHDKVCFFFLTKKLLSTQNDGMKKKCEGGQVNRHIEYIVIITDRRVYIKLGLY